MTIYKTLRKHIPAHISCLMVIIYICNMSQPTLNQSLILLTMTYYLECIAYSRWLSGTLFGVNCTRTSFLKKTNSLVYYKVCVLILN